MSIALRTRSVTRMRPSGSRVTVAPCTGVRARVSSYRHPRMRFRTRHPAGSGASKMPPGIAMLVSGVPSALASASRTPPMVPSGGLPRPFHRRVGDGGHDGRVVRDALATVVTVRLTATSRSIRGAFGSGLLPTRYLMSTGLDVVAASTSIESRR